jgi:predicted short-subunit dehydrogenase-like oxidoreductase (DUF2520 family)
MTFSIIGSGNMAWFIVRRLTSYGLVCTSVYGRNIEQVSALANSCAAQVGQSLSDIQDEEGHICIIAVSDAAIVEMAKGLYFTKTTLIHTSGTSSIDLLLPSADNCAVLWPIYSILKNSYPTHRNIPIAWQASSSQSQKEVLNIATLLSDICFEADEEQRRYLHLAAVFANNFTNHLIAISEQICLEQRMSFDYLKPILQQTFERTVSASAKLLQTGPARRNDMPTIGKHIQLLNNHPQWQTLYESLSMSIKKMYEPDKE